MPESTVHGVRGGKISARTAGRGPAVLLLHGVGTASPSYWAQFAALREDYELIAWDAFGYGASSEPPAEPRLDDYADAAADLLTAHGRENAHVAGVSWGGVVATRLALRHPGRVRTLTLISSTYGRQHNAAVLERFGERVAELDHEGVRNWARARVDRLVSSAAPHYLKERIVETAVGSVRLSGFAAATRTLADTDHRPELGEVRAPTLVLCGDQDLITGPPESRVLADGIPGAEYVVVPGGGHALNQEKPAEVNERLRQHWRGFDSREGEQA
ncbi:alpha/beta fold hydrolase [Amycolatopsis rhabdoformis]|uniref:Alpha/beta fold hydrolase n=1 Tax=Amycolatopsis rhabdoformis TaxID=1448059 RepID=A0ABZ1HVJ8_9PSEU|nr:alpha/beta fold hydrolase [Amycolatopsis rhabdoformis]WSE26317.1 alpha/beta fold hydrolase [Amycolatopsis rhabdoformis]